MKKLFAILVVAVLAVTLVACGPSEVTATGYGITHKSYVGEVVMTVDKDGKVVSASVEEYYLPYNFAVVAVEEGAEVPTDVVIGNSHGVKYFAKYVSINGVLFTAADNAEGLPVYTGADGSELLAWVADEANAKAYVDGIKAATVFVADETGAQHATYATPASVELFTKTGTNYGGDNWNWAEQVAAFATALVGTTMNGTATQNADTGVWSLDDVETGTTMVDFEQYYAVAQRAYATATAK